MPQPNGFSLICLVYFPSALQELKVVPRPVPALLIARKKGLENMKEKNNAGVQICSENGFRLLRSFLCPGPLKTLRHLLPSPCKSQLPLGAAGPGLCPSSVSKLCVPAQRVPPLAFPSCLFPDPFMLQPLFFLPSCHLQPFPSHIYVQDESFGAALGEESPAQSHLLLPPRQ